jgi:hypothetical protein
MQLHLHCLLLWCLHLSVCTYSVIKHAAPTFSDRHQSTTIDLFFCSTVAQHTHRPPVQPFRSSLYFLDDFTGLHLCSYIISLSRDPARCLDFNKPPQLLGSKPSYIPVFAVHPLALHSASPLVVPSLSPSSDRSMFYESHLLLLSVGFVTTSVLSMN